MNKGAAMSHPDPAQGDSAAHCPYEDDSPEGEAWMLGYQNGGGED